jgi:hypothetical protein
LRVNFQYKPIAGSLLPLQIIEPVSKEKGGKIINHECFHYHFFTAGTLWLGISHIFLLKPLKSFLPFKVQVPSNFQNKISAVKVKGRPVD